MTASIQRDQPAYSNTSQCAKQTGIEVVIGRIEECGEESSNRKHVRLLKVSISAKIIY